MKDFLKGFLLSSEFKRKIEAGVRLRIEIFIPKCIANEIQSLNFQQITFFQQVVATKECFNLEKVYFRIYEDNLDL